MSIQDMLGRAVEAHRQGRLADAEAIYRTAIGIQPRNPDALHLLGALYHQQGRHVDGLELIERALQAGSKTPGILHNHAEVLRALGRRAEAVASYRKALKLKQTPETMTSLAGCLIEMGETGQGEQLLRRTLQIRPGHLPAAVTLATSYLQQGQATQASLLLEPLYAESPDNPDLANAFATLCRQTGQADRAARILGDLVRRFPHRQDIRLNLAQVLVSLDRRAEAIPMFKDVIAAQPANESALAGLSTALLHVADYGGAAETLHRLLERKPDYWQARLNLGHALEKAGNLVQALAEYIRVAEIKPGLPAIHRNLGNAYAHMGRLGEAVASFDRAAALGEPSGRVGVEKALAHLLVGDYTAGWPLYASRLQGGKEAGLFRGPLPPDLGGLRILVRTEQGLGDELFFLRFIPELKRRGAEVWYQSSPKLAPLIARLDGPDRFATSQDALGTPDMLVALADLPMMLGMRTGDMPPPSVRLSPLPDRRERMMRRLAEAGQGPCLGITWRAGTQTGETLSKSAPLAALRESIADWPGTVVILQRAPTADELGILSEHLRRPAANLSDCNDDLEDMLALLDLLDEQVAVSNTNVHLRAALGRTSRVLIPRPEFRWMAKGDESPWFPGHELYRQSPEGEWNGVLSRLAEHLSRH